MTWNRVALASLTAVTLIVAPALAQAADYHHVHITTSSPAKGVEWYSEYMECEPLADRDDAANCDGVEVVFVPQATTGGSQGTGINHIGFSFPDLTAKMAELEAVGVRGSGVRLQRNPDGSTIRDIPGLFKIAFIFDPWGTRIELVEDDEYLGFHHIHLSATNPQETLAWYRDVMGGEPASMRGMLDGLLFDDVWLLVSQHPEGSAPATTQGRAIDHIGFMVDDLDAASGDLRQRNIHFYQEPVVPENGRTSAKQAYLAGPDNVRVEVVEAGFAGVEVDLAPVVAMDQGPFEAPLTSWGEPDLQGVWHSNSSHGIPLERPEGLDAEELTVEEAVARREGGTLGSIWGYDREWRDTTLGYGNQSVSTQVAMVIAPPDGRIPPLTPEGEELAAEAQSEARAYTRGPSAGPEDLTPYVRCITRGLPGMMLPSVYNNGLQIVQGPGYVAITKEMIHETRVIPTTPRPEAGSDLKLWLGVPQGRWEDDTLVIETTNFNGRSSYRGSTGDLTLTERYRRIGPGMLEYQYTIDDPQVWTRPWTAMFRFEKDDGQYELVEYACHEGNYGMTNILSGSRVRDAAAESGR
ncbi:MAG: VOC family protein [Acidobacteria bacterium]|nr:VOC family protein [Acidobacteriota bacterium]